MRLLTSSDFCCLQWSWNLTLMHISSFSPRYGPLIRCIGSENMKKVATASAFMVVSSFVSYIFIPDTYPNFAFCGLCIFLPKYLFTLSTALAFIGKWSYLLNWTFWSLQGRLWCDWLWAAEEPSSSGSRQRCSPSCCRRTFQQSVEFRCSSLSRWRDIRYVFWDCGRR